MKFTLQNFIQSKLKDLLEIEHHVVSPTILVYSQLYTFCTTNQIDAFSGHIKISFLTCNKKLTDDRDGLDCFLKYSLRSVIGQ